MKKPRFGIQRWTRDDWIWNSIATAICLILAYVFVASWWRG